MTDAEFIERIAQRVAETLRDFPAQGEISRYLTASVVAARLGVSRAYVLSACPRAWRGAVRRRPERALAVSRRER
jgi:hypothetical protein